jgi:hypothetical protein
MDPSRLDVIGDEASAGLLLVRVTATQIEGKCQQLTETGSNPNVFSNHIS